MYEYHRWLVGKLCLDNRCAAASKELPPTGLIKLNSFGHAWRNDSISALDGLHGAGKDDIVSAVAQTAE